MPTYISPFKLFNIDCSSTDAAIEANKSRTLNRFEDQANDDIIHLGSSKLPKSQVLTLLNDLDADTTRAFHIQIFQYKKLLNFLEYGHLNYFRREAATNPEYKANFWKFVAPFFGRQYGETLLQAVKTRDKDTLALLSSEQLPMLGDYEELCYQHANNYIANTFQEIKNLKEQKSLLHMSERELLSYLPNKTIELYNMLPDYFTGIRNKIGAEIYSLSLVLVQNYGRSDGASAMVKQGLKLKLDDQIRQQLEDRLRKFSFKSQIPAFIWAAIAVLSLLYLIKFLESVFFSH